MKYHKYGETKTISTGREYHQCEDCGQVDPVDGNTMANRYCYPRNIFDEQKEADKLFEKTYEHI